MRKETVLLTGISGYIALHTAKKLLREGYTVRGSVRNTAKAKEVEKTLQNASVDTANLFFTELNLNSDKGWDEAMKGCDYVIHMASPYVVAIPKDEAEVINPAVEGTLRVLKAARKGRVQRVVLTSSALAMMGSMKTGTINPNSWTDTSADIGTYTKSKTLAEKAAWDFIEDQPMDSHKIEMVSVNPGGVFGPPLGKNIEGQAMSVVDQMLRGKVPMVANVSMPMADVRDIAELHLQVMTAPNAVNKRVIGAAEKPNSLQEIAQILKDNGYKGPSTRLAPNFLIKLAAFFDREAKGMVGFLGMNIHADNSETRALFNWEPRSFSESVLDTAKAIKNITG
ncbi:MULTISPECIES: NAD-dependent epimerase/dehydratase family protein [unclassified Marinomonas]|uniref:NAD-dependent epimerase/dehydratase family protein n=1 Tax=unclassified Marinomonas TaxID=196814 RepID=UPI000A5CB31F|nr:MULTISPECIES: NAD-dependent epimerase/dehydratase family protein [unclassified Marinomonas]